MKALSILIIIFAVVAFAAMVVRAFFKHLNTIHPSYKFEKAAHICGIIGVASVSVAAICGLVQTIIPLL